MRILRNAAIGTALVIGLFLAFAAIMNAWYRSHMYYPAPENESAFLRTYSLKRVVLSYIDPPGGTSEGYGSGGEAGMSSVKHTADFEEYFTLRSEQKGPLIEAVDCDLGQQLRTNGAKILSQNGDISTGFKFRYRSGNSLGSVTIHPVEPGKVQRNMPLAQGLEDVGVRVEIEEEWFPKAIPAEVARALPEAAR